MEDLASPDDDDGRGVDEGNGVEVVHFKNIDEVCDLVDVRRRKQILHVTYFSGAYLLRTEIRRLKEGFQNCQL